MKGIVMPELKHIDKSNRKGTNHQFEISKTSIAKNIHKQISQVFSRTDINNLRKGSTIQLMITSTFCIY